MLESSQDLHLESIEGKLPNVIFENNPDEDLLKDLEKVSKDLLSYAINEFKTLEESGVIQVEGSSIKYPSKDQNIVKKLTIIYFAAVGILIRIYEKKKDLELLRYLINEYFECKPYTFGNIFYELLRTAVKDERSKELIKEECLRRLRENPDEPTRSMAVSLLETLLEV